MSTLPNAALPICFDSGGFPLFLIFHHLIARIKKQNKQQQQKTADPERASIFEVRCPPHYFSYTKENCPSYVSLMDRGFIHCVVTKWLRKQRASEWFNSSEWSTLLDGGAYRSWATISEIAYYSWAPITDCIGWGTACIWWETGWEHTTCYHTLTLP